MTIKKILMADDEPDAVAALADGLEYAGFGITQVRSGDAVLAALASGEYSMLVIDVMMAPGPKLRAEGVRNNEVGLRVVERIRAAGNSIPIFCVSVVSNPALIDKMRACNVRIFPKGETPLTTLLGYITSELTGVAYQESKGAKKWFEDGR